MNRRQRRASAPTRVNAVPATAPTDAIHGERRVTAVDALRGGALCLMFVYHFAFDLRYYGITRSDFEHDPFWLSFRALIVGAFMALVGVSLVLAKQAHSTPRHFWGRIAIIVACALLASAATWVLFPTTFIYFGILHAIAVASVLAWPLASRPRAAFVIGVAIIVAGIAWSHPLFNARPLSWIGFVTAKPATEDYVPVAPWAGVVALGIAVGHWLARNQFRALAPLADTPRWLRWLGRHSLFVYMIHQPVLLGVLWLVVGH